MKKQNSRRWLLIGIALLGVVGLVVFSAAASVLAYRQFAGNAKEEARTLLSDLQFEDNQQNLAQGIVILHVAPGSPAEQAGLEPGTIILSINGREVNSPQALKDAINEYEVGDSITLTVQDGEQTKDITATLADSGPYLGVNVGPSGGFSHFRGEGFGELPHGFVVPGLPNSPDSPGAPDAPEGMMPFEFHFDEFGPDQFPFDEFGRPHDHYFDLLGRSALIMSVVEDSPAAAAGLLPGDAIVAANGQPIADSQQLIDVIAGLVPGDDLSLEVQRGDESLSIELSLDSHPDDGERAYLGVFLAPMSIERDKHFFQERQNS